MKRSRNDNLLEGKKPLKRLRSEDLNPVSDRTNPSLNNEYVGYSLLNPCTRSITLDNSITSDSLNSPLRIESNEIARPTIFDMNTPMSNHSSHPECISPSELRILSKTPFRRSTQNVIQNSFRNDVESHDVSHATESLNKKSNSSSNKSPDKQSHITYYSSLRSPSLTPSEITLRKLEMIRKKNRTPIPDFPTFHPSSTQEAEWMQKYCNSGPIRPRNDLYFDENDENVVEDFNQNLDINYFKNQDLLESLDKYQEKIPLLDPPSEDLNYKFRRRKINESIHKCNDKIQICKLIAEECYEYVNIIRRKIRKFEGEVFNLKSRIKNATSSNGYDQFFGYDVVEFSTILKKKQHLFNAAPLGPLGFFLDVIDKKYAAAIECLLSPILTSYFVTCAEDKLTLSSIFKESDINTPEIVIMSNDILNDVEISNCGKRISRLTYLEDVITLHSENILHYSNFTLQEFYQKVFKLLWSHPKILLGNSIIVDSTHDVEELVKLAPPGVVKCCTIGGLSYTLENHIQPNSQYHPCIWVDNSNHMENLKQCLKKCEIECESWKEELTRFEKAFDVIKNRLENYKQIWEERKDLLSSLTLQQRQANSLPRSNQSSVDRSSDSTESERVPSLQLSIQMRSDTNTPRVFGVQVPLSSINFSSDTTSISNSTNENIGFDSRFTLHRLLQIVILTGPFRGSQNHGISQEVIDGTTKKFSINTLENIPQHQPDCPICLSSFSVGDELRELPCQHYFHLGCIDQWLLDNSSQCPMCRRSIEPNDKNGSPQNSDGDEFPSRFFNP